MVGFKFDYFYDEGAFQHYSDGAIPEIFKNEKSIDEFLTTNTNKTLALLYAIEKDDIKSFEYILPKANLKFIDDNDTSLGYEAAERSFKNNDPLKYIEKLVEHGFDVNEKQGKYEENLLAHFAQNEKALTILYKVGANANEKNHQGLTSFGRLNSDNEKIASLHCDNGVDTNNKTYYCNTLLEGFLKDGFIKTAQVLLEKNPNVNAKTKFEESMALVAIKGFKKCKDEAGKIDLMHDLIKRGMDINIKNEKGENLIANEMINAPEKGFNGLLLGAGLEIPKKQYEKFPKSFALALKELGGVNTYLKLKDASFGYNTFKNLVQQNQIKELLSEKSLSI